jgi:predicted MPP superfamily phosphohydrolase/membrane-associated phospholipid phosphatase
VSIFPDFFFQPEPIIWVQQFFGLGHTLPFRLIDLFAAVWGVLFAVALALWLWGREDAYALAAIVIVEALINLVLNQVFNVPRPSAPEIVKYEHIDLGSFPSGHVFTVTVLWGLLWARGRVPLWLTTLLVLGVGVGRLYMGVHYLADVVAGVLLGILLIWIFHKIWPPVREWFEERSYGFFVGAGVLGIAAVFAGLLLIFGTGGNPFVRNAAGVVIGGVIALLLEYRYVRYSPQPVSAGGTLLKVGVGVAGIVPFLLIDRFSGEAAVKLGATAAFAATFWALLAAPALFVRLDLSRERLSDRRAEAWHTTKVIMLTVLGVLAAILTYGAAVEPRVILDVETEPAPIPGLIAEWEGQSIAVLADFQSGMWWDNTGMMRRAVERAIEARPAVVLLAGDFIYKAGEDPAPEVREIAEILRPLAESGIPTYAVLGNHDWGLVQPVWKQATPNMESAEAVRSMLRELGIPALHNQSVPLRLTEGSAPLYIVGIGSHYAAEDEPLDALREVPDGAPRVVFMHHPDSYEEIPAGAAPIAIAGHTHGGQIALPFTPEWSWLTFVMGDEVHADGWIEQDYGAPGNRLYVNRGIGFSLVPIRIGAAPEITLFELRRGPVTEISTSPAPPREASRVAAGRPR